MRVREKNADNVLSLEQVLAERGLTENPIDNEVDEQTDASVFVASQWQLMWWRFRKHRLALISGILLAIVYLLAFFAGFFAPTNPETYATNYTYAPPQRLHLFHDGQFKPHVKGYNVEVDPYEMRRVFSVDEDQVIPLRFFVRGEPYRIGLHFIGLEALSFEWDVHFMGVDDPEQPFYLSGADRLGRDMFSRILYGAQISLSIGLVGVMLSLVIGIFLGGISGYSGGWIDNIIQRLIEFVRSIPTIPLWLGLTAALPLTWDPIKTYFAITVILSFIGWTDIARVVRGRFLSLREEDFVLAARLDGASRSQQIFQHMLPAFYSHLIAALTLAIPGMILAETALSFLGLGLRPPTISWGVLLQEAQNLRSIATAPWLLTPAVAVIITILTLNFLGDGIRDAADPYA